MGDEARYFCRDLGARDDRACQGNTRTAGLRFERDAVIYQEHGDEQDSVTCQVSMGGAAVALKGMHL